MLDVALGLSLIGNIYLFAKWKDKKHNINDYKQDLRRANERVKPLSDKNGELTIQLEQATKRINELEIQNKELDRQLSEKLAEMAATEIKHTEEIDALQKPIPSSLVMEIAHHKNRGLSLQQIGDKLNLNKSKVYRIVKKLEKENVQA